MTRLTPSERAEMRRLLYGQGGMDKDIANASVIRLLADSEAYERLAQAVDDVLCNQEVLAFIHIHLRDGPMRSDQKAVAQLLLDLSLVAPPRAARSLAAERGP